MLDKAETAKASFEATLESLTVPILLVDAERRLIHANPAGWELLNRSDPLHVWNGYIGSTVSAVTSALGAAVNQAANDESQIGRKGLGIPVRRLDGSVGALHILPFRKRRTALDRNADAVAAVFVAQIDTPFVAPTEMIAALFGLTPAEARVFDSLVSGNSVLETALAQNVQRSTIKTHLLRLYAKIGVRRQADLLQVAASLRIPIAT
jgi:DNA-binding CsgD family transcriptional regulator